MKIRSVAASCLGLLAVLSGAGSASADAPTSAPTASVSPTAAPAFDGTRPRPFMMSLRGASTAQAWVTMQPRGPGRLDEAVVDLGTGCVVETLPPFVDAARLGATGSDPFSRGPAADVTKKAEALIADPAVKADVIRFVATGRRFGLHRLGYGSIGADGVAFSGDGTTIAVESAGAVFRSHDGGKTYDRLDANMSRYPYVTADGKYVVYERCSDASRRNQSCPEASREVRIVAADNSVPARTIPIGSGLLRGLDPTGQKVVVVRYDLPNEVTAMHVDPSAGTYTRVFGVPAPPLAPNRFHDIDLSRKGGFGVFDNNDKMPFNIMTVMSMTDGKIAQTVSTQREMGTEVDEESGRIMWQTYPDDHAWAKSPKGAVRDLGMGDPLGWAPGGRALVFNAAYSQGRRAEGPAATLGAVACKIVRITTM